MTINNDNRMKEVNDFAIKWLKKFSCPHIDCVELIGMQMSDDCLSLGFMMDCGQAFFKKYGSALFNFEELNKIIDDITDIPLLGSAIYSQWRYFNHYSYSSTEILESANRNWFITALTQMAKLSADIDK